MRIDEAIKILNGLREEYGADGVKVYLIAENNWCIKFIKNGKIIKIMRIGSKKRNSGWDLKR